MKKKIEAIIGPENIGQVRQALEALGCLHFVLSEVRVHGAAARSHEEIYRGAVCRVDSVARLRLEVVVDDWDAAQTAQAIREATGDDLANHVLIIPVEGVRTSGNQGSAMVTASVRRRKFPVSL